MEDLTPYTFIPNHCYRRHSCSCIHLQECPEKYSSSFSTSHHHSTALVQGFHSRVAEEAAGCRTHTVVEERSSDCIHTAAVHNAAVLRTPADIEELRSGMDHSMRLVLWKFGHMDLIVRAAVMAGGRILPQDLQAVLYCHTGGVFPRTCLGRPVQVLLGNRP